MNEKAMQKRREKLEKSLDNLLNKANGSVEFQFVEYVGSKDVKGLEKKGDEIFVVDTDDNATELEQFYVECGTDMTYEDYLESLVEYTENA